ncbi:uncharacterized protein zgc:66474 isoform X2 [Triplophysa rosa]|uniref:uncharacterized protein zgc:66474 isoform X2 n=1 Tax=Triplophysa rosa TaxID=992332 RepID=UPI002546264E|nr:uncharacterized protein zgc:66474 isoform X2 [Triplophysa rosa]
MTKLQLLHRALNERMMAAVEQIMEMVGGTVLEYEEETARVRKENEVLRRRLQSMEDTNRANWPGPYDPVSLSTLDESTPSQQEQCAVSFEFEQESQTVLIKTEFADDPLYIRPVNAFATLPQSTDQGFPIAGTSASITYSQTESVKWPSSQNYMEPLEFDPTPSTMFTYGAARGKRQRMSFACPDCGKVFGREQTLMFHLRTHSAAKPYEYRRRKACFYGDGLRKRKLRGLSQISRENTGDVSDGSGQANRSRPSAENPAEEQELDSVSTNSNQTSNANVPENIASNPEPLQRKKVKKGLKKKYNCSMCGDRFSTSERLEFHMNSHEVNAVKSPNPPSKEEGQKKVARSRHSFPCLKCDKVFRRLHTFNSHMRMSHLSEQEDIDGESESVEVPQKRTKKICSCPHCGKVYTMKGCLRTHIRTVHTKKITSTYFQIMSRFGRTRSQRSLNQQLMKTADEATLHDAGTHICEICDKVFASSTWLIKHMCISRKEEQPVLKKESKTGEMQRKKGRANKKPSRKQASEESEGDKKMDRSKMPISPATCNKKPNPKNPYGSVLFSHLSLQPKVVLEPIMPKRTYWNTVPSIDACKSSFNVVHTSSPALADNKNVNVTEGQTADHCSRPAGSFSQDKKKKVEKICSVIPETDIVCVTIGPPQNDSQSELVNQEHYIVIDDEPETEPIGTKRKDISGKKLKTAVSKSAFHKTTRRVTTKISNPRLSCLVSNLVFSDSEDDLDVTTSPSKGSDKKKTAMLDKTRSSKKHANDTQEVIVIDDEQQQTVTQTGLTLTSSELIPDAENHSKKPRGTKRTRLWVNKQTAVSKSDCKDDIDEDSSKGFDENHPSVCLPNDSQILNSEAESLKADDAANIKSIDSVSQQTDGDGSVSQEESCETSELILAGRGSLLQHMRAHADKKLLDVQDIIADDKTNKPPSVNVKMSDRDDSEESGASGKTDSSVKNVKSSEEIDMLSSSLATSQSSKDRCTYTKSGWKQNKEDSFCETACKSQLSQTLESDIGTSVLQGSSVDQTDHPQPDGELSAVNQPCVSNVGCSDTQQIVAQQSDCDLHNTGLNEDIKLSSRPKEEVTSGVVSSDSSSSQDLQSNSTLSPAIAGDTQQTQVSDVQRGIFIGSGSSDVKTFTDPDSCNAEHTQHSQPERIGSPDPDRRGTPPDPNLNPPVQDIKPAGQTCYPKSKDCDLTEDSYKMTGDGSDDAAEAQQNSATSVTGHNKRKREADNISPKEESKKRHPSAHPQPWNVDDDSQGDVESVIPDSKVYACQHCTATFCRQYTLRRHQYTHTDEKPFWCHQCNVGFIQKYRLLHHTLKYHDEGKRPKRRVHGENTTTIDETSQNLSAESPGHLSDDVKIEDDTASTNQGGLEPTYPE